MTLIAPGKSQWFSEKIKRHEKKEIWSSVFLTTRVLNKKREKKKGEKKMNKRAGKQTT